MKLRTFRIRFRIPGTSNPTQETHVEATSTSAAKNIFEAQYKGMAISSIVER